MAAKPNLAPVEPLPALDMSAFESEPKFRPIITTIAGEPGVGKSWFALSAKEPFLLNADDGAAEIMAIKGLRYQAKLIPQDSLEANADLWDHLGQALHFLKTGDHNFQTVVMDSLDGIEKLAQSRVCKDLKIQSMEQIDYGKAYVYAREKMAKVLAALGWLRDNRDMEIIVVAHTSIKSINKPHLDTYDGYELTANKHVAADVKRWCDAFLFMAYRTFVQTSQGKFSRKDKVALTTDERYIIAQGGRGVDCKNRFGLPTELSLADGETDLYAAYKNAIAANRNKS